MKRLEELRKKLGEVQNSLAAFTGKDQLTGEDVETVNALNAEWETLTGEVTALEAIEKVNAQASASARKTAPVAAAPKVVVGDRNDKGNSGFETAGSFYSAVRNHSIGRGTDKRLQNSQVEKFGEDGGFLVPEDFRSEIKTKVEGDDSLLPRTDSFNVSGNRLSIPTSETAPWDNTQGIVAYWEGEAKTYRDSQEEFKMADWRLHKLTALVKASDELLEDSAALGSFVRKKAPQAMIAKINSAIISGDGVGKPRGILNSGFTLEVAAEGGQAIDTIVYKNLIKMDARNMGRNKVWYAHPEAKEQLRQLKDDNGNFIYLNGQQFSNAAAAPFDTLLGKPIVYMMGSMPALGDSGDIILGDLSYYITAMKVAGIQEQVSTHVFFDQDLTAFKFSFRVAGDCPYQTPITTEFGGYQMSAFTKLASR